MFSRIWPPFLFSLSIVLGGIISLVFMAVFNLNYDYGIVCGVVCGLIIAFYGVPKFLRNVDKRKAFREIEKKVANGEKKLSPKKYYLQKVCPHCYTPAEKEDLHCRACGKQIKVE